MNRMIRTQIVLILQLLLASSLITRDMKNDSVFTFKVDDLKPRGEKLEYISPLEALQLKTNEGIEIEDFSHKNDTTTKIVNNNFGIDFDNSMLTMIHTAYVNHYPFELSVSDFIFMIGQGLAKHMEVHAEDLRDEFVYFLEKEMITVDRDEDKHGSDDDWSFTFGQFSEKIEKRGLYNVITDDTSVATKLTRIVSEINMMAIHKQYFEYVEIAGCGISKVTLIGSREDWESLRTKVRKLKALNGDNDRLMLDWWLVHLVPLVDKLVDQAVSRDISKKFWRNIYQIQDLEYFVSKPFYASEDTADGWIKYLHPYLKVRDYYRNPFNEINIWEFPSEISSVPLIVTQDLSSINLKVIMYGGILGCEQLEDLTMRAVYFYAVFKDPRQEENSFEGNSSDNQDDL